MGKEKKGGKRNTRMTIDDIRMKVNYLERTKTFLLIAKTMDPVTGFYTWLFGRQVKPTLLKRID